MNKFKAVIFDMDGTLVNTIDDIADSVNAILVRMGLPQKDIELHKMNVGQGAEVLVYKTLPEDMRDKESVAKALDLLGLEYGARWKDKSLPYDGIPETLDELQKMGIKMSILSNKHDFFTKLMAGELLSKWHFEEVFGLVPEIRRKPDAQAALMLSDKMNIPPNKIIFVGDTAIDMQTANNAGMYGVGVLWGFRDRAELEESGAREIISSPKEIIKFF